MRPRKSSKLLSLALHCSWLVAAERGLPLLAAEPLPPETQEGDLAYADPVANANGAQAPLEDFAIPTTEPSADLPAASGVPAVAPIPLPPADSASGTAQPDGVPPAADYPLPAEAGGAYYVENTPGTAGEASSGGLRSAHAEALADSSATSPAGQAAADDRSAPWVAAPGGFSSAYGAAYGAPYGASYGASYGAFPAISSANGFNPMPTAYLFGGGLGDDLLDGLSLGATLSGTYDSNPSQGYGPRDDSGEGDFFLTLGGNVGYRSTASDWTYGVNYSGSYSEYFTQSELSGYNQSLGGSVNYEGGPLTLTLTLGLGFGSGANRYYESVVDELSCNYGLSARYRVSPKTSLTGDFSQSFNSASDGGFSDIGSFNLGASALYRYSSLTEFGPGIRYTRDSGDSQMDRSSFGPTMTVNYTLSRKVSLNSRIGVDFASYEDGTNADPSLSGSIGLNYRASSLWGMNLSLNRDMQADPSKEGGFSEITALRLGYHRKIRRVAWNLGLSYETNAAEAPDGVETGAEDRDYLSFDSSLGMPLFADTCNGSVFLRYSDESGGTAGETWDSIQTGFSLSRSF